MSEQNANSPQKGKPACLIPNCPEPAKTRGLCATCYAAANEQVRKGDVTWEKLVELGLANPSARESSARDRFKQALAQALRKEEPSQTKGSD